MKNIIRRAFWVFFVTVVAVTLMQGALGAGYSVDGFEIPIEILINGNMIKTPVPAFLDGGTTYAPVRAVSEALGAQVLWHDQTKTASVLLAKKNVEFVTGQDALIYRDTLFVPVRKLSESLGFEVSFDDYYCQVNITSPDFAVNAECIDTSYTNEDILLIAKVLYCEAYRNSFDGQIAVANIITNRVKSELFPNSVREVIYDRRYGSVQFSIAYNGMLENTPARINILAAKCALSGTVVARDCLFYQADYVKDSWTNKNREYAMSVGGNAFFY